MGLPFKIALEGKTAVVTGGGGVLCAEFCRAFAACGATVAVLGHRSESITKVADAINADSVVKAAGGSAFPVVANVLDKDSLERARLYITEKTGGCDILVNGAGGNNPRGTTSAEYLTRDDLDPASAAARGVKTFFDLDAEGIEAVFNLNYLGTLLPTQVFARGMVGRESPVIINISSMNAFKPLTKIPAYSGAKAAVSNLTQWLAVHFAPVGIRVNAIAPGFFVTEQNRALLINEDGSFTARSKKILAHTPMNRFGEPSELVGTLLWLCDSNASGFVNGTVIPVDGGFSAYSGV
jgi:Dehydrogenases with different specificities (related to short-chain alcohol dehydrogenases)